MSLLENVILERRKLGIQGEYWEPLQSAHRSAHQFTMTVQCIW